MNVMSDGFKTWMLTQLAPNMRAPQEGILGWFAMRRMAQHSREPIRLGIARLNLSDKDDIFVELGAGHGWGLRESTCTSDNGVPKRIVNVEISAAFRAELEKVKATVTPEIAKRVEIHGEDCISMPYLKDNSVDQIFGMNVVYFLDPLADYVKEIHRVLKPGVGSVTFGCHFGPLPRRGTTNEFINIDEEPIVKALEQGGFTVEVERDLEPTKWSEIKATKDAA